MLCVDYCGVWFSMEVVDYGVIFMKVSLCMMYCVWVSIGEVFGFLLFVVDRGIIVLVWMYVVGEIL